MATMIRLSRVISSTNIKPILVNADAIAYVMPYEGASTNAMIYFAAGLENGLASVAVRETPAEIEALL